MWAISPSDHTRSTVANQMGLRAESNLKRVSFSHTPPRLAVAFDVRTASALLTWGRSLSPIAQYEVQRQADGDALPRIVRRSLAISDTSFLDTGLSGDTEYAYQVSVFLTAGVVLNSEPISGSFHIGLKEWTVHQNAQQIASDAASRIYVSGSLGLNEVSSYSLQGEVVDRFPVPPVRDMAADRHGPLLLIRQTVLPSGEVEGSYLQAYTSEGEHRFRWPATQNEANLRAVAVAPDGMLWLAKHVTERPPLTRFYRVDPVTGEAIDVLEVGVSVVDDVAIGHDIGVVSASGLHAFNTRSGDLLPSLSPPGQRFDVSDIVFGSDGRLFVSAGITTGNSVMVFKDSTLILFINSSTESAHPVLFEMCWAFTRTSLECHTAVNLITERVSSNGK